MSVSARVGDGVLLVSRHRMTVMHGGESSYLGFLFGRVERVNIAGKATRATVGTSGLKVDPSRSGAETSVYVVPVTPDALESVPLRAAVEECETLDDVRAILAPYRLSR